MYKKTILIIGTLVLIMISIVFIINAQKKSKSENIIINDVVQNDFVANEVYENIANITVTEEQKNILENETNSEISNKTSSSTTTISKLNISSNMTNKSSSTKNHNKQTSTSSKTTTNNNTKIKNNTNNIPVIKEESKKETGEKYVINNEMISKLRNTINKNKTEDMVQYGYNIIVDNSIIKTTNYFTFSEKRVISKLKYIFGTIKIYAQDYYVDGKYITTQCFID